VDPGEWLPPLPLKVEFKVPEGQFHAKTQRSAKAQRVFNRILLAEFDIRSSFSRRLNRSEQIYHFDYSLPLRQERGKGVRVQPNKQRPYPQKTLSFPSPKHGKHVYDSSNSYAC
jgi:hypothetical protein